MEYRFDIDAGVVAVVGMSVKLNENAVVVVVVEVQRPPVLGQQRETYW